MPNSNVFDRLSEKMGAPGSKYFPKILEAMMTAEEAEILLDVSGVMTAAEIAEKRNVDEKSLQTQLDKMDRRQIIRRSGEGYMAPANIVAFHHGAIGWMDEALKSRVYPMWGDFFYAEWRDIILDGFIRRKASGAPGGHRVVPAHKALRASPKIKPKQILWYEDMEQILRRSEDTNIMMCGCRGLWRQCDKPIDTCMHVQYSTSQPRRRRESSEFIKPPKSVSFEEALAVIDDCEDRGMIHIPLNTSQGDLFCNCCNDCCMVLNPLFNKGMVHEILSPSRYRAIVDTDLCSGCQTCIDRCMFDAIEMKPVTSSKKLKSSIISGHCMGCGVCVITCPKGALTLELVRPPEHIPTISTFELLRWGHS
jgi:ferredoxin